MVIALIKQPQVFTEIRIWDVVAKALEAAARMYTYTSHKPDTFWFVLVHSSRLGTDDFWFFFKQDSFWPHESC